MRGPINPKYWLRGVKPGMEHQSGGTVTMGKWYCPDDECLASWHWGSGGSKRMLIFNDPDEGLQLVMIGDVTPEEEHMITCIKSAVLLEATVLITGEKVAIGVPAIINGIRWLNDQCEQTLLASNLPKVWRKAVRRETIQNTQIIPYCQRPQMSLSEYGITYCALQASDDTPAIDPAFCRRLLETLCYFYTFTGKPTSKGALATAF